MNVALFLEIKNEYTEHLVDTLTPYIYEGLVSIYKDAARIAKETNDEGRTLIIFQKLLQAINNWNQQRISDEAIRIKQMSNTSEYLDDLIKAVIKSNIILLAYSNTISNIIGQTFYNSLTTQTFIHRCYTECGKDAHNNPYLYFHDCDPMDYKRNQLIIQKNIQLGITRAIRKILPISMILKEYLVNSVNIIQEPAKVELIGVTPTPLDQIPPPINEQTKIISDHKSKLDPNLEKEVMKIMKSESIKTDKEKIQAIMNIDKIITSLEPNRLDELSAIRLTSSASNRKSNHLLVPHLLENEDIDLENSRLGESDKKILNINFDDEKTVVSSSNKSVSNTSMNSGGMPTKNGSKYGLKMDPETSERIDPTKIQLIEDYGTQNGGGYRNRKLKRKFK